MCARKRFATTKPIHGGFRRRGRGATSSNQTRTELMTLSRRNFLRGNSCGFNTVKRNARRWSGTGERGGNANLQGVPECSCSNLIYPRSRNFRYFWILNRGISVWTQVGLGLRYCIRVFVRFRTFFYGWGILNFSTIFEFREISTRVWTRIIVYLLLCIINVE